MTIYEMKRLINKITAQNQDDVVLNMMFHSMEVIPNASPYVRSEKGQRSFLNKLKAVFGYLKNLGFESKTLIEIYNDKLR